MDAAMVGRETELAAVITSIEKGNGAVLAGPAGIGKTRLALEAASGSKRQVWWMAATADSASIPYGAFHPLLPELGDAVGSDGAMSAFSLIQRRLSGGSSSGLLVVDDAHHLDRSSAATVHALVRGGHVPVVATVRDGEPVPGAITALWKDIGLERMEIRPLDRADTEILALHLLDGVADQRTLARFWTMSRGHPLELRELILSAQESGTLSLVNEMWTFTGSFEATSRLVELVEDRLGRLAEEDRIAAETLAYAEPLDIQLLARATAFEVIERLERANVVRILRGGSLVKLATMAHPLYGEVLRATIPATRRSALAAALASAASNDDVHPPDPLRLATWRLESGEATAEELERAAISAVQRMAWDLALRFGMASVELAPSYMGHGCVAAALAELGDPKRAEAHLLMARELVHDPRMLAWNTISLADVWFYHAGRMEDALELVRKEVMRTTDREIRDDVVSALAINLMMYGNVEEVLELSQDVLESPDSSEAARLMALVASSSADGLTLRPGEVRAAVDAAMPLLEGNRHRFANAEDILFVARCVAELATGDLVAARAIVDQRLSLAVESDSGDLPGMWTLYSALLLLYEGDALRSYETQLEALLLLDRYDSWLSTPLALVGAAHAAAVMANADDARSHLAALRPEMHAAPRIRARISHVEALLTSLEEGLTAGAAAAVAAGDEAAADSHLLWAVEAWHLAVRLGSPDLVVSRLAEAAASHPGTVAGLYAAHAQALESENPQVLERVVQDFDNAGLSLFAAEAACQVCGIHRRRDEANLARRAAALARELLPESSGVRTPPFSELPDVVPLTRREREVALLAAGGMPSKEIADRLYISVRSVDNHLSRVYFKLGVTGRSDLSNVLMADTYHRPFE
jgi:DNA-binding CsgD family transcriptional regulator